METNRVESTGMFPSVVSLVFIDPISRKGFNSGVLEVTVTG